MAQLAAPLPMEAIHDFCRRWKISRLEVFGSILRDDFGADSDVDFLVTWAPDADWDWTQHCEARGELEKLVGRRIDFVSRRAIEDSRNWIRREDILGSAQVLHAA